MSRSLMWRTRRRAQPLWSFERPADREERRLLDTLLQPPADLIEQLILLPVDIAAGLIVCPPGLFALVFQLTLRALTLELLGERRRETGLLLGLLERLIHVGQLGLERIAAILGPAVELVHLVVEPVAVAGGHLGEQRLTVGRQCLFELRRHGVRHTARRSRLGRQVEQEAALRRVHSFTVVGQPGEDELV